MSTAEFDNVTELDVQNLRALVELQRAHFRAEGEVSHATRVDRLKRLKALIVENKTSFASTKNGSTATPDPMSSACSQSTRRK